MLGGVSSGLLGSSGLHDGGGDLGAGVDGGVSANSSMFGDEDKGRIEEGDRSSAGNRWPRQETLALLKIRSDMDVVFRDSSLKGPLWEDVSRKMAELGYQRSAKKCKEKFENVYKYHKRTKEGRSTKSDGKTYRFFDQLQALGHHHPPPLLPSPPPPTPPPKPLQPPPTTTATAMPAATTHPPPSISNLTVPSTTNPIIPPPSTNPIISYSPVIKTPNIPATQSSINPSSHLPNVPQNFMSNSTSSSTSSDQEFLGRRIKKRKWKDFFQRLMTEVVDKQEELQKRFLEAIEKREHDRMVREEAWKMQEMARLNREHEILVQERSIAAAKDAAVIAFLQKISDQQINLPPVQVQLNDNITTLAAVSQQQPQPQPQSQPPPQPQQPLAPPPPLQPKALDIPKLDNGDNSVIPSASSSRWPKAEVQALINLRKSLDLKYQENGPKGPLWEEISGGMKKLGYNRNAKRCKEKWENINKYFKKVKESNKQRPEDSKTCPYFHLLDALYKEKNNKIDNTSISSSFVNPSYSVNSNKLDHHHQNPTNNMVPLMVQPEQQWPLIPPPPQSQDQHRRETVVMMEDVGSENNEEGDDDEDDDGDEDDEEVEGGDYEIVSNKQPAANTMGNVE